MGIFRTILAASTSAVALATAVAPAPVAASASTSYQYTQTRYAQTLNLISTANDLITPPTAAPGLVTFSSSTTDAASGWIGLTKLRPGVTWARFRATMQLVLSSDPASVVEGSARLGTTADLLGGVVIHPGQPATFTQWLRPGEYVLFDYLDIQAAPAPRFRTLTVTGPDLGSGSVPPSGASVTAVEVPNVGPRFVVTGTIRAGQAVRFVNQMTAQANEAIFFRLADGVTRAELLAYFTAISDTGTWPDEHPFDLETGLGCLPLSGLVSSTIQIPLLPGRHVIVNWLKDADDGRLMAAKGHFAIVDVV